MTLNQNITLFTPQKLVFGSGCLSRFIDDLIAVKKRRVYFLAIPEILHRLDEGIQQLRNSGCALEISTAIANEPSFADFKKLLLELDHFNPDTIVGIGGGSVLDTAKLLATITGTKIKVEDFLAGKAKFRRQKELICLPTTAGTGSEVSPNAIFFDSESGAKVGVIDPQLVPDASYIDPMLTIGVPPSLTASTGLDALTHCVEAYVNNFSNPYNDLLALEGIRLIGRNLKAAFVNGNDLAVREKVAMGSMYGGMCLGPVNTGAVHALAYPLGSTFKIAHGVSNALLLPFVLEYNLDAAEAKYAEVALALGAAPGRNNLETAQNGISIIRKMIHDFGIPNRLSAIDIQKQDIETMAKSALKIQRLLKNNVKEVCLQDAIEIYEKAF